MKFGRSIGFFALASLAAAVLTPRAATADDTVTLLLTLKDHKFDPAELHAPAGVPIEFHVKNQNGIVSEFESSDLHFEKIVPNGSEAIVHPAADVLHLIAAAAWVGALLPLIGGGCGRVVV